MVPCGPECWPAPFTTVATVSIAILLAMCIVVTTFGNLLVLVSFVVERQIRHGSLNIWTWKSNIVFGKPQWYYCGDCRLVKLHRKFRFLYIFQRKGGLLLPLFFQYIILMIWRACDLNLIMIYSLAKTLNLARGSQFHFIKGLKNRHSNFRELHFWNKWSYHSKYIFFIQISCNSSEYFFYNEIVK